jgi:hypothetical protein
MEKVKQMNIPAPERRPMPETNKPHPTVVGRRKA